MLNIHYSAIPLAMKCKSVKGVTIIIIGHIFTFIMVTRMFALSGWNGNKFDLQEELSKYIKTREQGVGKGMDRMFLWLPLNIITFCRLLPP